MSTTATTTATSTTTKSATASFVFVVVCAMSRGSRPPPPPEGTPPGWAPRVPAGDHSPGWAPPPLSLPPPEGPSPGWAPRVPDGDPPGWAPPPLPSPVGDPPDRAPTQPHAPVDLTPEPVQLLGLRNHWHERQPWAWPDDRGIHWTQAATSGERWEGECSRCHFWDEELAEVERPDRATASICSGCRLRMTMDRLLRDLWPPVRRLFVGATNGLFRSFVRFLGWQGASDTRRAWHAPAMPPSATTNTESSSSSYSSDVARDFPLWPQVNTAEGAQ
jgi:hypothetical protein